MNSSNNKVLTLSRCNYSQNELVELVTKSIGKIDICDGNEIKTVSKKEIYYVNPNKYTLKFKVDSDISFDPNISQNISSSSGIGGYGLNLI